MPCILHIETSTKICSVALSVDGGVVFNRENKEGASHAAVLGGYVADAVGFVKDRGGALDAVAVSAGPGSYTGLRIGLSEAKGLCYGFEIPLIAVSSLKLIADIVIRSGKGSDYYCPMIDARRMEVYAAIYDKNLNEIRKVQADIVDEFTYVSYLCEGRVLFFGDGSDKCQPVIRHPKVEFMSEVHPLASSMVFLSEEAYVNGRFEDVAYFEPFYLKEFRGTISKNKVISGSSLGNAAPDKSKI